MSNSQAIAAVTATLHSILQHGVPVPHDLSDATVTILPLDKARAANTHNQLNLYYLLTAFGRDDDALQPFGHELLGKAMSILHDHPVLSADDIRAATSTLSPASDLDQQIEHVRLTFQPLSIDELSKLWTGFGMQYRLSAAYEAAVALIESTRATRTPLPVLTRGDQKDRGIDSSPDLTPPVPTLQAVTPPNQQPSARLNDVVALTGVNFDGTNIRVQFGHPLWTAPVEVPPQAGGTATALTVQIQPAVWPAGFYTVAVLVRRPGETFRRTTNALALALAPSITIAPASAPAGTIVYTVTVAPQVWPTQRASLMLGDNEFLADPHAAQTPTLTFSATGLVAGDYWVRLRVDGVDSLLVDRTQTPPVFDTTQQVTVT